MNRDGVLSAPWPVITQPNISVRYDSPRRNNESVCAGRAYDSSVAADAHA